MDEIQANEIMDEISVIKVEIQDKIEVMDTLAMKLHSSLIGYIENDGNARCD